MTAKVSKRSVDYSEGTPQARCGVCKHFRAPNACGIVAGKIAPDMWCRRFSKKPGTNRAKTVLG